MKYLLVLVVGLAIGYAYGYGDGSSGKPSIAARVVGGVGGKSRQSVGNDVDAQMKAAEDTTKKKPK